MLSVSNLIAKVNLEISGRYDKQRVSKPESFRISKGKYPKNDTQL